MAIKIREQSNQPVIDPNSDQIVFEYIIEQRNIPNLPAYSPRGLPRYTYVGAKAIRVPSPPPIEMPEADLPRSLNYAADYGGCGWWRLFWPEAVLNGYNKGIVTTMTQMIMDIRFYGPLKSIRMQRQATEHQNMFIKELAKLRTQNGMRLIYEIDDIVFKDDIPDYNRCKEAFLDPKITASIIDIMKIMDEITVTCPFMKEYYKEKTGNKNITVIPNYPPKFWLDRYHNRERIENLWEKNKKRPRILYAGSGTHIDVLHKLGGQDDFAHVVQAIIKARKKFKFVFKGAYPIALKPFVDCGDIEYIEWSPLFELPKGIYNTECQAAFAPLTDNIFNKSKSNIKIIESGALGIPGAFQDLCTYEMADFKFKSGDDLINQLEEITEDFDSYMKYSDQARAYVDTMWLEDHIDEHYAINYTGYGTKERQEASANLIKLNPEQAVDKA